MKTIEKTFYRIYDYEDALLYSCDDKEEADDQLAIFHEQEKGYDMPLSRIEIETEEVEDEGPDPDDAYDIWREQQEFN